MTALVTSGECDEVEQPIIASGTIAGGLIEEQQVSEER
jgi:hypothetical protein